jgi:hypothetical protein
MNGWYLYILNGGRPMSKRESSSNAEVVVEVRINQQQEVALQRLREDGKYGSTDAEILRNVFREFLRQTRF